MIQEEQKQLYSQGAIGIATFVGGPLAAGVLVRRNYINLGNDQYGKHALSIGIISTLLIFGLLFSVPEHIVDKIPNFVIPAVYTAIISFVVEKLQGEDLKKHKDSNGVFYSGWKAAGVGFVCMIILGVGIFGYALTLDDFDADQYNKNLTELQKHEDRALELFTMVENEAPGKIAEFIMDTGIPAWERCITTLAEMDKINGLPTEFKNQNEILREYCLLRIQSYRLIEKANTEDTDHYNGEIEILNKKIEDQLAKL
jgi:hypothetical protein